jgi:hypothetical protein
MAQKCVVLGAAKIRERKIWIVWGLKYNEKKQTPLRVHICKPLGTISGHENNDEKTQNLELFNRMTMQNAAVR